MTIDGLETSRRARILVQMFPPAELLTGLRGGLWGGLRMDGGTSVGETGSRLAARAPLRRPKRAVQRLGKVRT